MRRFAPLPVVAVLLAASYGAADDAGVADDGLDALFEADVVVTDPVDDDAVTTGADAAELLTSPSVEWGGSFRYAPEVELTFPSHEALFSALRGEHEAERALRHDLGATLYLDARPSGEFRVFAKAKLDHTLPPADSPEADSATGGSFAFSMFELFADFDWDDRVFFRAGKQRADWGVGRFFSPADLISLATIDPLRPDAEREGPIALKAHAPLGVHNAYLYLITGDFITAGFRDPLDVAVGVRGEVVIEGLELGFGGLLQADLVPKGLMTATGSLSDLDLFGELVIQRGTERNLIELDDAGRLVVTHHEERDEDWFHAATAGASYFVPGADIVLTVQYYFNPLGYDASDALAPARGVLIAPAGTGPPRNGPRPTALDLLFFGRHYAGASAVWLGIGDSDLSTHLYWVANLNDRSGVVQPSLVYHALEHLELSLSASIGYGSETLSTASGLRLRSACHWASAVSDPRSAVSPPEVRSADSRRGSRGARGDAFPDSTVSATRCVQASGSRNLAQGARPGRARAVAPMVLSSFGTLGPLGEGVAFVSITGIRRSSAAL